VALKIRGKQSRECAIECNCSVAKPEQTDSKVY
jgi:hypothetical protein